MDLIISPAGTIEIREMIRIERHHVDDDDHRFDEEGNRIYMISITTESEHVELWYRDEEIFLEDLHGAVAWVQSGARGEHEMRGGLI